MRIPHYPPLLFCLEVLATSIAFYFISLTLSFAPKKELEFGRWEETKKPNNPNTTPLGLGELLLEFQCDTSPTLHYSKILWIFGDGSVSEKHSPCLLWHWWNAIPKGERRNEKTVL